MLFTEIVYLFFEKHIAQNRQFFRAVFANKYILIIPFFLNFCKEKNTGDDRIFCPFLCLSWLKF